MEFKELITFYTSKWKKFLVISVVFGLIGAGVFYFVPQKYIASGSLFISRQVSADKMFSDFTYEGYYAQQTAQNYTGALIAFLESIESRKLALDLLDLEDEVTLRKFKRSLNVKKSASQVVNVSFKHVSEEDTLLYWNALTGAVIESLDVLNETDGDMFLKVTPTAESPVVYEAFRNVYLNVVGGVLLGNFVLLFWLTLTKYLE